MMTRMKHVSHSPVQTQEIASAWAKDILKHSPDVDHPSQPIVIALEGELGAGKTTFVQAFADALGVIQNIKSPTFVLMKHYQIPNQLGYNDFYHLDCYRLQSSEDLKVLGIEDVLNSEGNIVVIEWAERVSDILPTKHWVVHIYHVAEQTRNISITQK